MRQIRYEAMIVGGSNQCSILRLSDYESRHEKSQDTEVLAEEMLDRSMNWIIDGAEIFNQINALLELVRYLRNKNSEVFIHLKTHNYNYYFLRCASLTDEILDCCDVLTDKNEINIDLRATIMNNNIVYWEVSE